MKKIEVLALEKGFLGKSIRNPVATPFFRKKGLSSPSIAHFLEKIGLRLRQQGFF